MPITQEFRIFLETKPVPGTVGSAGHLYLVLRQVSIDDNGIVVDNSYHADTDRVIRGNGSLLGGPLTVTEARLDSTPDAYSLVQVGGTTEDPIFAYESPTVHHSFDFTSVLAQAGYGDALSAWDLLKSTALGITQYNYQASTGPNSNSVIFSVFNGIGVDLRDIASGYVDSFYPLGHPGGDSTTPTLIATDSTSLVYASPNLTHGVILVGRDQVDDLLVGTRFGDKIYGEQSTDYTLTNDTLSYAASSEAITIKPEGGTFMPSRLIGTSGDASGDELYGIENIIGSNFNDDIEMQVTSGPASGRLVNALNGRSGDDILKGGGGNDYLDGGRDTDTALYDEGDGRQLTLTSGGSAPAGFEPDPNDAAPFFTITRSGETDVLHSIEKIKLSEKADTLVIGFNTDLIGLQEIDAGGQDAGTIDILDVQNTDYIFNEQTNKIEGFDVEFKNFEGIYLPNGSDIFRAPIQYKEIHGDGGADTFQLTDYTGFIDGGADRDTAEFTGSSHAHSIALAAGNLRDTDGDVNADVDDIVTGSITKLKSVEEIELDGTGNIVTVGAIGHTPAASPFTIDLGATLYASGEVLNFSSYGGPVYLSSARGGDDPAVALYTDQRFSRDINLHFQRFNTLTLTDNADKVELHNGDNPYLHVLNTGQGDDVVDSDVVNLTINFGSGTNTLKHAGQGSIVNLQGGHNTVRVSDDVLLVDARPTDIVVSQAGWTLHGAIGRIGQESPWITGWDGTKYGLNSDGQLAVRDAGSGATLFIAGYQGGPNVPFELQTAGIFVGLASVHAERLIDVTTPLTNDVSNMFKLGNQIPRPNFVRRDDGRLRGCFVRRVRVVVQGAAR
jgi:RTX calcium-binding nonapeptide repeat (4 copies)